MSRKPRKSNHDGKPTPAEGQSPKSFFNLFSCIVCTPSETTRRDPKTLTRGWVSHRRGQQSNPGSHSAPRTANSFLTHVLAQQESHTPENIHADSTGAKPSGRTWDAWREQEPANEAKTGRCTSRPLYFKGISSRLGRLGQPQYAPKDIHQIPRLASTAASELRVADPSALLPRITKTEAHENPKVGRMEERRQKVPISCPQATLRTNHTPFFSENTEDQGYDLDLEKSLGERESGSSWADHSVRYSIFSDDVVPQSSTLVSCDDEEDNELRLDVPYWNEDPQSGRSYHWDSVRGETIWYPERFD